MAYKQHADGERIPLPGWQVLEVAGADASAFLQAQLMNDLRTLALEHWQWNGWLNPKGRLIALLALIARDADRYWLLLPDFPADEFATRLQRFVFRSKLTMRVRTEMAACADFNAGSACEPVDSDRSMIHDDPGNGLMLDFSTAHARRGLWLQAGDGSADATARLPAGSDADCRWRALDLAHGLPRLESAQSELWTPQMLSLDRLDAYSLKKGCYPGQEIVARTHYLGQAKRGLVRIEGDGVREGAEIRAQGRALGTIISCVDAQALAVLSTDRPDAGWDCAGVACRELPLLDGLAR